MSAEVIRFVDRTLADGTMLPGCRADLLNIGALWARGWSVIVILPTR